MIPPKRANEAPENRIPFNARERCISFPPDVLSLVRLMTKKISAVIVQIPLTTVPIVLNPLKNPVNSDAEGASEREVIVILGIEILDASAIIDPYIPRP